MDHQTCFVDGMCQIVSIQPEATLANQDIYKLPLLNLGPSYALCMMALNEIELCPQMTCSCSN